MLPEKIFGKNLHALIDSYLDGRFPASSRVNNKTFRDHRCRLGAFCDSSPDVPHEALDADRANELVQRFLDLRRFQGYSACSIDNDRRALSACFAWLIRQRLVAFKANPAFKQVCNCERPEKRVKRGLADAEVKQLLDAAKDSDIYPYILLCVGCGLRPVGASRVRPGDVDLASRTLKVFEKRRERLIPLSGWFVAQLSDYQARGHSWVWLHQDTVAHKLEKIRETQGLPAYFTLQALRRTFIRKLFENDISPQLAAKLAGNSVQVIERHYLDLSTLNATKAVDVVSF